MADNLNKPNLVVPLVPSYNQRGTEPVLSTTRDQRKVNCYYQQYSNNALGQKTVILTKRPGTAWQGTFGSGTQTPFMVTRKPGSTAGQSTGSWLICLSGTTIRASDNAAVTTNILTAASSTPAYWDMTNISGTETLVLQIRDNSAITQRTFYSSAIATWTEISDADFTALVHRGKMEHLDGWPLIMDNRNRIYNGDLNSLSSWQAANYLTKNIQQDNPAGLAKFKNQILAFGDNTVEILVNAGNPSGSPLVTVPGRAARIGLGTVSGNASNPTAPTNLMHYYAVLGDKLYFIGREAGDASVMSVYAYNGESFAKVSNPAIDRLVSLGPNYSIHPFSYQGTNAVAIEQTAPGGTTGSALLFFPEHNEWFEFQSTKLKSINYAGMHCGIADSTKLFWFRATDNTWQDDNNGAPASFTMTVQFTVPKKGPNTEIMHWCAVDADTTTATSSLLVELSDDDGQTFGAQRVIDLNLPKKILRRCGAHSDKRVVRLTHGDTKELRLTKFMARVS